jgi:misacylated tRNA(Ala) deacylase
MKHYESPEMHTAEHILNQTMVRMFDCGRSFSSHIEKKKSKCDYHFGRDLTEDEKKEIEKRVNGIIKKNLPVSEDFLPVEKAASLYNLERLPGGRKDRVRIVKIGDYDACPCIGQHVPSTGTIGMFKITTSSYNDGVLRVRFKVFPGHNEND